ncbi:hypothetical protein Afil01_16830 [Actinorhabdospora filicis]|uniref:YbaB/EbfC DNA-binding family protein n=1 Tax=Actinorhabdospora filicis TaxID=1785913 RepID=A0A9W6SJN8_9ACTN|nr:hypothetical protein [Actinorhabdospora filicis]GLZ76876.1 hypothetical protein Afil01_16830 [Actinorhabdospora filicis]
MDDGDGVLDVELTDPRAQEMADAAFDALMDFPDRCAELAATRELRRHHGPVTVTVNLEGRVIDLDLGGAAREGAEVAEAIRLAQEDARTALKRETEALLPPVITAYGRYLDRLS